MAKDHGDKHPSDIGDQPPVNPTENFTEIDVRYLPPPNRPAPEVPPPARVIKPEVKELPDIKRETFTAIVTNVSPEGNHPRLFAVLRQDMRRVNALAAGNEGIYDEVRIGDTVQVTAGELPNTWIVVCSPKSKELPVIKLRTIGATGNNVFTVPFNILSFQTGDETILTPGGGGVVIGGTAEQEFIVQVSLDLTLQCINASTTLGPPTVTAQAACLDTPVAGTAFQSLRYPFRNIRFDRSVGFLAFKSGDHAEISLSGNDTFYMLYQPAGGGAAVWTNWPKVASAITVGAKDPQAWLILENNAGTHVWLGTGNKSFKYVFPDNDATPGAHLMVGAVQGEGVKLKHSKAGGRGEIMAYGCDYTCKTWKVEDGLIVSGPGISEASEGDGTIVGITEPQRNDFNPC